VRELGVTIVSARAYNILAAIVCTLAAAFTTVAVMVSSATDARNWGIAAGVTGVFGGLLWVTAAIKG
jgi:hypothetical protein